MELRSLCFKIEANGLRRWLVEDLGDLIGYKLDSYNPYSNCIYFNLDYILHSTGHGFFLLSSRIPFDVSHLNDISTFCACCGNCIYYKIFIQLPVPGDEMVLITNLFSRSCVYWVNHVYHLTNYENPKLNKAYPDKASGIRGSLLICQE